MRRMRRRKEKNIIVIVVVVTIFVVVVVVVGHTTQIEEIDVVSIPLVSLFHFLYRSVFHPFIHLFNSMLCSSLPFHSIRFHSIRFHPILFSFLPLYTCIRSFKTLNKTISFPSYTSVPLTHPRHLLSPSLSLSLYFCFFLYSYHPLSLIQTGRVITSTTTSPWCGYCG